MNTIPLQNIIPNPELISIGLMKIILKKLINSTFNTQFNTPKCNCVHLRKYQRIFSSIDYQKKYSSPLFESTKCLMLDGVTHARLFDRRTSIDLRCPLLGKISLFPFLQSSSASLDKTFISLFIFSLFILY